MASPMAKQPKRPIEIVLGEARRALRMSQREFGAAIGSSHRTAARWDAGRATPTPNNLRRLAGLLYPQHHELATEVADAADETLESLGLEAAPAPLPPPPAHRTEDIVDIVVLTAVDQTGAPVATARSLLHAVFKRAAELGLTVEAVEKALRPVAVRSERDDTH
jgi:transcriptional regulator with XRE-family HTH domain